MNERKIFHLNKMHTQILPNGEEKKYPCTQNIVFTCKKYKAHKVVFHTESAKGTKIFMLNRTLTSVKWWP